MANINKRFGEYDMGNLTCLVQMNDEYGNPSNEHLEITFKVTQEIIEAIDEAWKKKYGK